MKTEKKSKKEGKKERYWARLEPGTFGSMRLYLTLHH